jgi:hypothetical protein
MSCTEFGALQMRNIFRNYQLVVKTPDNLFIRFSANLISTLAKELYIHSLVKLNCNEKPERLGKSLGHNCTTKIEFPDGYESHETSTPKSTKQVTGRCLEPRLRPDRLGGHHLAALRHSEIQTSLFCLGTFSIAQL